MGSGDLLAARRLCELSPLVQHAVSHYLLWDEDQPDLAWHLMASDLDAVAGIGKENPMHGLAQHDYRLAQMAASLIDTNFHVGLRDLAHLGRFERDALTILVEWASDRRCTVVDTR